MHEKIIEKYLVERAESIGALVRKTAWVGRNACPDRLVMLPHATVWVEVKAPNQTPTPAQAREHDRMRQHGQIVWVVDSKQTVDNLIQILGEGL